MQVLLILAVVASAGLVLFVLLFLRFAKRHEGAELVLVGLDIVHDALPIGVVGSIVALALI